MVRFIETLTLKDVEKINDFGYYANITKDIFMKLSDEQIRFLRRKFPQCQIAKKRLQNKSKRFKLIRKSGHKKIDQNFKYVGVKVAVCGVIMTIAVSLATLMAEEDNKKFNELEVVSFDPNTVSDYVYEEVINDVEFVKDIVHEETEQEKIIKKYCDIYQVDFDVVYEKICELTENFTNESYLNDLHIEGIVCKSKDVYARSEEELLLLAVRCIKQKPELLGLTEQDIRIKNGYDSGTNYVAMINEISKVLNSDRVLIYAIFQAETSFNSDIFFSHNNPGGMKDDEGNWWYFDNKYQGFIELCLEVRKYNDMGAYSIEEIACIHAPLEDNNENWIPNVTSVYEAVKADEKAIFGDEILLTDGKGKVK